MGNCVLLCDVGEYEGYEIHVKLKMYGTDKIVGTPGDQKEQLVNIIQPFNASMLHDIINSVEE